MKSNKPLWRLSVTTTLEAEDAVAELLGATLGQPVSSHFDVEKDSCLVSLFGPQKAILNRGCRQAISAGLARIKDCGLNTGPGKIKAAKVRREDWAESWKRHFKAIEIGKALLIKPSWIKRKPRRDQAVVILDPGLSFGTGQHATTSFCLHEIARLRPAAVVNQRGDRQSSNATVARSFLDMGTGSGILAIAAVRLGYGPVRAFDFDPESVRVARVNVRNNHVEGALKIGFADVRRLPLQPRTRFHLVCANLISNLLIAERQRIVSQLHPGGTLVLAGILKQEFARVQDAFEGLGLKLASAKVEKEWRSGSFRFVR